MTVPAPQRSIPTEIGAMDRALDRASGARAVPGNDIRHLTDGPAAFVAMQEVIVQAERWVHFENYIINDDTTGRRFATLLLETAERGVTVRVLYDYFGCRATPASFWKGLREGGVQVRAFNPVNIFRPLESIERNHRKYVSTDGRRAIVGGLCIGDEWSGDPARKRLPWRDTAVLIHGPAVPVLDLSFAHTWALTGEPIPDEVSTPRSEPRGSATVRVIEGIPGNLRVYRTIELMAAGAAERLWITDAYLLPPAPMLAGLIAAAKDGLDVRLLVPGRSDLPPLSALSRVGYRELLKAGARIWEWRGPMLHAKTVIVDSRWFKVGSSNLNSSSLRSNYELDLLVEDEQVAGDAVQQFRTDLSRSVEVILRRPRWARGRLGDRVAVAQQAAALPEIGGDHQPSTEERSRRAVVYLRQVASGARRSIAGATVFSLLGGGVLFLTLPKVMATILAVTCFWLGGSAAWHFYQRRRLTSDE
ncbi:MAG: cardiolipin synthase B [Gemmatimonadetes bacterium]|nr:cardiolipin synthase B [Gemmatimonadota bacterium]